MVISTGVTRPEREADYLPPFSVEVKNGGSNVSSPLYDSIMCTGTNLGLQYDPYIYHT